MTRLPQPVWSEEASRNQRFGLSRQCTGAAYVALWSSPLGQSLLLSLAAVMLQNMESDFELLSELTDIETIAVNLSIRERQQLRAQFGGRR